MSSGFLDFFAIAASVVSAATAVISMKMAQKTRTAIKKEKEQLAGRIAAKYIFPTENTIEYASTVSDSQKAKPTSIYVRPISPDSTVIQRVPLSDTEFEVIITSLEETSKRVEQLLKDTQKIPTHELSTTSKEQLKTLKQISGALESIAPQIENTIKAEG